jgi:glutathione S-transferase
MDLNEKAQWHLDFNGGLVPILENPQGELIKESGIIAQFAIELGGDEGVALIPKDPFQAAKMRLEIERCSKIIGPFF